MRDPWKEKYFGPVEEVFIPKPTAKLPPYIPPYILHWEFSNGHKWNKHFKEQEQMEVFLTQCGLRSHPNIVKLSFVVGATGKTVVLSGTIEELT